MDRSTVRGSAYCSIGYQFFLTPDIICKYQHVRKGLADWHEGKQQVRKHLDDWWWGSPTLGFHITHGVVLHTWSMYSLLCSEKLVLVFLGSAAPIHQLECRIRVRHVSDTWYATDTVPVRVGYVSSTLIKKTKKEAARWECISNFNFKKMKQYTAGMFRHGTDMNRNGPDFIGHWYISPPLCVCMSDTKGEIRAYLSSDCSFL